MNPKIRWFVFGFVISWLIWSTISYANLKPKNNLVNLTGNENETFYNYSFGWLESSIARQLGAFQIVTASDKSNASAMLYPIENNQFPKIIIQDAGNKGSLNNILISDSAGQTFSLNGKNCDGQLDSYSFGYDNINYYDFNMDGQFDCRNNADDTFSVFINSEWHELTREDDKTYIDINGDSVPVTSKGGIWTTKD